MVEILFNGVLLGTSPHPDLHVGSFQSAMVGVFTPREPANPPHQGVFPAERWLFENLRQRDKVRQWPHGEHSRPSCSQAFLT